MNSANKISPDNDDVKPIKLLQFRFKSDFTPKKNIKNVLYTYRGVNGSGSSLQSLFSLNIKFFISPSNSNFNKYKGKSNMIIRIKGEIIFKYIGTKNIETTRHIKYKHFSNNKKTKIISKFTSLSYLTSRLCIV
jgi:hypothetical protein